MVTLFIISVYHLQCGCKHGIIGVIFHNIPNHAIACSWPSESKELCEVKKVRENKGGGGVLEQANHS